MSSTVVQDLWQIICVDVCVGFHFNATRVICILKCQILLTKIRISNCVNKEREEIKRTTKQKMARRHNREGGNLLD